MVLSYAPLAVFVVLAAVYALTRRLVPARSHPAEALVLAIVAVLVVTHALDAQHDYYNLPAETARDIARQASLMGLLALGAGIVIIAGGIDLSAGSMVAFAGAAFAATLAVLSPHPMTPGGAVGPGVYLAAGAAAIGSGVAVGSLHAWLITVFKLPPFIATLATLVGLRSLARVLLMEVNDGLGAGRAAQIDLYAWTSLFWLKDTIGFRVALLIVAALVLAGMMRLTVLGRHIYALGGNEQAARLSGIRTDGVKWFVYVLSAVLASVVGIITVCDETVASPETQGVSDELFAIAASVVGGCALTGGVGTILGILLGSVFLRVVIDGVGRIVTSSSDVYKGLILGIVLVIAVTSGQVHALLGRGQRLFPGPLGAAMAVVLGVTAALLAWIMLPTGWPSWAAGLAGAVVAVLCAGTLIFESVPRRRARAADGETG